MVERKLGTKGAVLKYGMWACAVLAALILLFFLTPMLGQFFFFGILIAAGVLWGGWYLSAQSNLEFEYIFTSGELDFDKIINKSKRKRVLSVNVKDFEKFEPYKVGEHVHVKDTTVYMLASTPDCENNWYAVFTKKGAGRTMVVFEPSERMLDAMQSYIPRAVSHALHSRG